MRKLLIAALLIVGISANANPQNNALGFRYNLGYELSFQFGLKTNNRVELDLGIQQDFKGLYAAGLYQWIYPISNNIKGFNYYFGVGGRIGTVNDPLSPNFNLGATGQIGLEYHFPIPLMLSLDWRPTVGIKSVSHNASSPIAFNDKGLCDLAIAIRYQF